VIGKYIFDLFSLFDSIHDVHHSQVNVILGNLLRLHYPGVVVKGAGRTAPVTSWRDYARAPDIRYENAQRVVRNTFWVSSYMFITSVTSCNT
jgi:hypothetical protein